MAQPAKAEILTARLAAHILLRSTQAQGAPRARPPFKCGRTAASNCCHPQRELSSAQPSPTRANAARCEHGCRNHGDKPPWSRKRTDVARDLIPQIACSNSYVLRLRNQRNWCSASCTAHRSANPPLMTTPSPDGTLTSRQSGFPRPSRYSPCEQFRPEHLSYGVECPSPLSSLLPLAWVTSPNAQTDCDCLAAHPPGT